MYRNTSLGWKIWKYKTTLQSTIFILMNHKFTETSLQKNNAINRENRQSAESVVAHRKPNLVISISYPLLPNISSLCPLQLTPTKTDSKNSSATMSLQLLLHHHRLCDSDKLKKSMLGISPLSPISRSYESVARETMR